MRSVESSLQAVAQRLNDRVDDMVEEMLRRMEVEIADYAAFEEPELVDATRRSAYANIRAGVASMLPGRSVPGGAPAEAEQGARRAARSGAYLPQLLASYRVGHAVAWEYVLDEIEALDLPRETRGELLRIASRRLFEYVESVMPVVTDIYTQERDALLRSSEHRRLRALRELLDGTRHDAGELAYDLRGEHLGAIAWGEHPGAALAAIARALECRSLVIAADEERVWGWFAITGPRGPDWSLIESLECPEATLVALGTPGTGSDGFRRTHREAQRAYLVACTGPRPITRFDAVAVEALALRDEAGAREHVARELGPLAADDARSATLRDTLRAYFEASSNASAAAALLGVNDRTVAYRLRGIEDLLGYPVSTRSLELRVALRLEVLFRGSGA
jgi:hypothetical protein